jgi:hypothetical protein
MNNYPKFAMYGHHKCATMSLNTIANAVCKRLGLNFEAVFDEHEFHNDLPGYSGKRRIDFLSYGNADNQFAQSLPAHKGFHIVRDPRDIVVSAYFSHRNSHSTSAWTELEPHREKLRQLSEADGILEEIRFRERSFRQMQNWDYEQENILEIRFEDLISQHYETLLQIFDHLGLLSNKDYRFMSRPGGMYRELLAYARSSLNITLPRLSRHALLPAAELLTIVWRNRFEAKTRGRNRGDEDVQNHYRKGKAGDWINHFADEHKTLFKELYPGLVPSLGYGESDDW